MSGLLESKRFWAAIASILFAVLHDKMGLDISEDTIQSILQVVASLILGDSLRKILPKNQPAASSLVEVQQQK